jgi:translocation and assembly module TamB
LNLDLNTISGPKIDLEQAKITATGSQSKLDWQARTSGRLLEGPFWLSGKGRLKYSAKDWSFQVLELNGQTPAKHRLGLFQPASFLKAPKGWRFQLPGLQLGPGQVSANGNSKDKGLDLSLEVDGLPLAELNPIVPWPLSGETSGELELNGSCQAPKLMGSFCLQQARIKKGERLRPAPLDAQVNFTWRPGRLAGDISAQFEGNGTLTASARLPLEFSLRPYSLRPRPNKPCSGKAELQSPVTFLPQLFGSEGLRLDGHVQARAELGGTWQDPAFKAQGKWSNGYLEHIYRGILVQDIDASFRADSKAIRELSLTGRDGAEGQISIQGQIPFRSSSKAVINAQFERMALIRKDQLESMVSGEVQLSGPLPQARLTGTLRLNETKIRLPEHLPPTITGVKLKEINVPGQDQPVQSTDQTQKQPNLDLDLDLKVPGHFFVRGRGLETEFKGRCQVTGTTAKPRVSGELNAVWGHYDFFGKTLGIATGQLFFEGRSPPAPRVNVSAKYEQDDFLAQVRLSGPIREPNIDLRSKPQLPKEEILGRILFGRSATNLNPVQAVQLAQALRALSSNQAGDSLTSEIFAQTRRLFDLDEFGFSNQAGGPSLGMGKYLRENVFVWAQKGLENEEDKIKVEVDLAPHTSVESQVGGQGRSGVSLNWKLDY